MGRAGRMRARRQPRFRHPQAGGQRLRAAAPVVSRAANRWLQRADVGEVRAAICGAGVSDRRAAVIVAGAYGADVRAEAGGVAEAG